MNSTPCADLDALVDDFHSRLISNHDSSSSTLGVCLAKGLVSVLTTLHTEVGCALLTRHFAHEVLHKHRFTTDSSLRNSDREIVVIDGETYRGIMLNVHDKSTFKQVRGAMINNPWLVDLMSSITLQLIKQAKLVLVKTFANEYHDAASSSMSPMNQDHDMHDVGCKLAMFVRRCPFMGITVFTDTWSPVELSGDNHQTNALYLNRFACNDTIVRLFPRLSTPLGRWWGVVTNMDHRELQLSTLMESGKMKLFQAWAMTLLLGEGHTAWTLHGLELHCAELCSHNWATAHHELSGLLATGKSLISIKSDWKTSAGLRHEITVTSKDTTTALERRLAVARVMFPVVETSFEFSQSCLAELFCVGECAPHSVYQNDATKSCWTRSQTWSALLQDSVNVQHDDSLQFLRCALNHPLINDADLGKTMAGLSDVHDVVLEQIQKLVQRWSRATTEQGGVDKYLDAPQLGDLVNLVMGRVKYYFKCTNDEIKECQERLSARVGNCTISGHLIVGTSSNIVYTYCVEFGQAQLQRALHAWKKDDGGDALLQHILDSRKQEIFYNALRKDTCAQ